MSLKLETREIAGVKVETQQLPMRKAARLLWDLSRSAPYVVARMAGKMKVEDAINGIQEMLIRLDSSEFEALYMRALEGSTARAKDGSILELGNPLELERAFEGSLEGLFGAIQFALEVNFAGFMSGALAGFLPRAPKKAAAK